MRWDFSDSPRSIVFACCVLGLLLGGLVSPSAQADSAQAQLADGLIAGWYEMSPGHFSLVTPGGTGGPRLLNFESRIYYRMKPLGDGAFRWDRQRQFEGRFIPAKDGKPAGLRWRAKDKSEGVAPRSDSYGYAQEEVNFKSGDIRLTALLLMPHTPGPHPGIVFIPGSGGVGRDNIWPLLLGNQLAMNGVAVLLLDKRGTGTSGGDWKIADFWELATDALAGVTFLRGRERIDTQRVGLIGMSQGGWIAPLAAARSRQVAFVVDISGPTVPAREQILHQTVQDLKRGGASEANIQEVVSLQKLLERHLRGEIPWEDYEAALKAKRKGIYAILMKDFPDKPDDWQLGFYQRIGPFDPLPYWQRLEVPFLIVYGEKDENHLVPVRASVARLREAMAGKDPNHWALKVFPDTDHGLGDPKTNGLRKDFVDCLTSWIHERGPVPMR